MKNLQTFEEFLNEQNINETIKVTGKHIKLRAKVEEILKTKLEPVYSTLEDPTKSHWSGSYISYAFSDIKGLTLNIHSVGFVNFTYNDLYIETGLDKSKINIKTTEDEDAVMIKYLKPEILPLIIKHVKEKL